MWRTNRSVLAIGWAHFGSARGDFEYDRMDLEHCSIDLEVGRNDF